MPSAAIVISIFKGLRLLISVGIDESIYGNDGPDKNDTRAG